MPELPAMPAMPDGYVLERTTPEFTDISTPAGLRRAHRVARGVWGRLRVLHGAVTFVFEDAPGVALALGAGDHVDIPPDTAHRVEPAAGCRFVVEFHVPATPPA